MSACRFQRLIQLSVALHHLISLTYAQAPTLGDPGTPISDQQLNTTYTHLVGFEECNPLAQRPIITAFWDAARILNRRDIRSMHPGDQGIDWNLPAAVEYLGSPFNRPYFDTIQALYDHAATFEPSYINWPTDFTINARCDDPLNSCPCNVGDVSAYTLNSGGSNSNGPYINFCPPFFAQRDLRTRVSQQLRAAPIDKFDVNSWDNQAATFLHEMFHIDRISSAPPNRHVTDLWLHLNSNRWLPVYGAELSKVLARTMSDTERWVMESAENLALFAMVTHYQAVLFGEYPSRPFAAEKAVGDPRRHRPFLPLFNFEGNSINVNDESALGAMVLTTPPESVTCSKGEPMQTFPAMSASFAAETDLPEDYQSSLRSWKSTWSAEATAEPSAAAPTNAAQPTPTPPPKPSCRPTPSGTANPPKATASAFIDTFCKDPKVNGALISNESPFVDLPYGADNVPGVLHFMASWKPTDCHGWGTIDTKTCSDMLKSVLDECEDSPGTVVQGCMVYSYDVVEKDKLNPSIPKEYISRGTYSCKEPDTTLPPGAIPPDTCLCSWSANPSNTEMYKRPEGVKSCADMQDVPAEGQIGQPQKKRKRGRGWVS